MIDFDALVLAPAQAVFGRPITVTPTVSNPSGPSYGARGIWSAKPVTVILEDGAGMNSRVLTLGIRNSEFTVMLMQGDLIDIPAAGSLPRVGVCKIDDLQTDGQGGTDLILKIIP